MSAEDPRYESLYDFSCSRDGVDFEPLYQAGDEALCRFHVDQLPEAGRAQVRELTPTRRQSDRRDAAVRDARLQRAEAVTEDEDGWF